MKSRASHYAISYKLPHEVTNTNPNNNKTQDLVLQYEVKLQQGLTCGGAYIKLLIVHLQVINFSIQKLHIKLCLVLMFVVVKIKSISL